MIAIDIIRSTDELARIAEDCDRLSALAGLPMLRHDWLQACATAFADRCELAIYVARDRNGVRAIAPLVEERALHSRRLAVLGHQIGEPERFGFADSEALAALCRAICAAGLPIFVKRLPEGCAELEAIRQAARGSGFLIQRAQSTASAWAPLDRWERFSGGMSASSRRLVNRRLRQASKCGEMRLEAQAPDPRAADVLLDRFIKVEAAGWKGEAGTAIAKDSRMETLYRSYVRAAAEARILRLFFLTIGGETVAARLAVVHGDRLWEIKIGYDEAWKRISPGIVLTHKTLQYACDNGLKALEYLGTAEPWQERWPRCLRHYHTLRFYPYSLRGGIALTGDSMDYLMRARARERLRAEPSAAEN